jgi:transcription-repair coupling factor (superfamily II helicase)
MYCQLLEEAVKTEQGEDQAPAVETTVDLQVDAYIPEDYIRNHEGRIEMYQKIAAVCNEEDAQIVEEELIDRYGDIPPSVQNLVQVATIRHTASRLGVSEISQKGEQLTLRFADEKYLTLERVNALITKCDRKQKIMFCPGKSPFFRATLLSREQELILRNVNFMLQVLELN